MSNVHCLAHIMNMAATQQLYYDGFSSFIIFIKKHHKIIKVLLNKMGITFFITFDQPVKRN